MKEVHAVKRLAMILLCLCMISSFAIKPPTAFARSSVDIVFIIDRSGSMDTSINAVKTQVTGFANKLSQQGIPFQLGLISYETYPSTYPLTSDVNTFIRNVSQIYVDGSIENGLDAIMEARNYTFELNSTKYFILIGDEEVFSQRGYTQAGVIQTLKNENIILTTIGGGSAINQFQQMAPLTGGQYLSLSSNFEESLEAIFKQINSMPSIEDYLPQNNQLVSDVIPFSPAVTVKDVDNEQLHVEYFLDGGGTASGTQKISNTQTPQYVTFPPLDTAGLAEGNHTILYKVRDSSTTVQAQATFRLDKSPPNMGNVGVSTADNSMQVSGAASDSFGLDAVPYRYLIGSGDSGWIQDTAYTQPDLLPNTAYSVVFQARDAAGHVNQWNGAARTRAQIPFAKISSKAETALQIGFTDHNPGQTQYQIQINNEFLDQNGQLSGTAQWIQLHSQGITATGLKPGKTYTIRAKAKNDDGIETSQSSPVEGVTLAYPPANFYGSPAQRSIALSWETSAGATQYEVELDRQSVTTVNSTAYTHSGLSPNTRHEYRIRALTGGGAGTWSPYLTVFTLPDPPPVPGNISAVPSQTEIALDWDVSVRAEAYEVEADGTVYPVGALPQYTHRGLTPKTNHTYRVRALNPGGVSEWSQEVALRTLPYPPVSPEGPVAQPSIYSIAVSWNPVEEADAYELEVDGLITDVGNTESYLHEGLEPVSGHTYRVRAKNAGGKSPWSAPVNMTTHPEKPTVPTNIMGTADEASITLTWYKVLHTDRYQIEVDGAILGDETDNQYMDTGLTPNSRHTYRVRAVNISGKSEWTAPVSMKTLPEGSGATMSLTNVVALVTNNRILISWDTVSPDAKYDVEIDGTVRDNGAATLYNHTGLAANEFHTYKIRIQDGDGSGNGEWIAILSLSTLPDPPGAPDGLEAFPADSSIELRWEKVEGASGYDIEVDGQVYDLGASRLYMHDELASGTSHTYRIRAKNQTGVTAWSNALVKSTTSPDYTAAVTAGQSFEVSLLGWNIQDFSELSFVVTYNPDELEITDLYDFTPAADLMGAGNIPGTALKVEYKLGKVIYRMSQSIEPGTSWSGELAAVRFKSAINGSAKIRVTVE